MSVSGTALAAQRAKAPQLPKQRSAGPQAIEPLSRRAAVLLQKKTVQLCQDALPEPTRATAKKKRGEPRGEAEMDQQAVEDAWLCTFWKGAACAL